VTVQSAASYASDSEKPEHLQNLCVEVQKQMMAFGCGSAKSNSYCWET
jgi:ribosomal protein L11 methylase PrmA